MKIFKIILLLILMAIFTVGIISEFSSAKLDDETLEIVDDLRWKHSFGTLISITDCSSVSPSDFEYEWTSMWFEDGKLIVSTNKGKWFIEMTKMVK